MILKRMYTKCVTCCMHADTYMIVDNVVIDYKNLNRCPRKTRKFKSIIHNIATNSVLSNDKRLKSK